MAPRRIALLASGALLCGLAVVPYSRNSSPATSVDGAPVVTTAATGATVQNLPLIDQDGRSIRLRDFAGRVIVLTFLYTRCPMPEFCPLMVSNLEGVRRRANDAGIGNRMVFVGVTLDPVFDTPPVLREYGVARLKDRDPFEQWTLATGSPQQIADVARLFGIDYRPEDGIITHTLMTSIIDADGRIVRMFPSNAWRPDELFDAARRAAGAGSTP